MKSLQKNKSALLLATAALLGTSAVSNAAAVLIMSRATLNDYSYTYGNGITAATNNPANTEVNADFTNAIAGEFPGFGSGGNDTAFASVVADPTVATQDQFIITGFIDAFGAANATDNYQYAAELQFQDFENSLGITDGNNQNAVLIAFNLTIDGTIAGPQMFTVTVDGTNSFNRGSLADIATLVNTSELDAVAININAGQGTDFYGQDPTNGFRTSGIQVTQEQVPEPSSALLMALSALALTAKRRR